MAQPIRVAILGAGWPGLRHAEGYKAAGGFDVAAVADLIPERRKKVMESFGAKREFAEATEALADPSVDAVSVCLPNHLHLPVVLAALKAKKHVICETPPTLNAPEAKKLANSAAKAGKTLLYAAQRRFGGSEQAAKQAVEKAFAGEVHHARAAWMRTRAVPAGSAGWYTDRVKSGGGVVMDLGVQMLDLARDLLGNPRAEHVYATTAQRFGSLRPEGATTYDVEDTFFAIVRFEGGKTLELSAAWAINQPPAQNGTVCRLHGDKGSIDVYTRQGPVLHRNFTDRGDAKATLMKLPKVVHYPAMMVHFRQCIQGKAQPLVGPDTGLALMQIVDAIYKSAATGKSVEVRTGERAAGETHVGDDAPVEAEQALSS